MQHKWKEIIAFVCKTTDRKTVGDELLTESPTELKHNSNPIFLFFSLIASDPKMLAWGGKSISIPCIHEYP